MTTLREAAEQALEALEQWNKPGYTIRNKRAAAAVRAALAQEPQTTHSEQCWRWHHACAVAEVERLRAALAQEALQDLAAADREIEAALAQEPQTTHSDECWRWHRKCAIAKIERECE